MNADEPQTSFCLRFICTANVQNRRAPRRFSSKCLSPQRSLLTPRTRSGDSASVKPIGKTDCRRATRRYANISFAFLCVSAMNMLWLRPSATLGLSALLTQNCRAPRRFSSKCLSPQRSLLTPRTRSGDSASVKPIDKTDCRRATRRYANSLLHFSASPRLRGEYALVAAIGRARFICTANVQNRRAPRRFSSKCLFPQRSLLTPRTRSGDSASVKPIGKTDCRRATRRYANISFAFLCVSASPR